MECPWRQDTDVISSVMSDKQETQQLVVMLDKCVFVFSAIIFNFFCLVFDTRTSILFFSFLLYLYKNIIYIVRGLIWD